MRILVVGAGAIGGYFGGRLLQAGRDVTFLVRPRRAAQLKQYGLSIRSSTGNWDLADPPTVQSEDLRQPFDLVLLSCKAYDLEGAIQSFAAAVGPGTMILPLLNGLRHLDVLEAKFGTDAVLGGQCVISASLDEQGRIVHLNDSHTITFGERAGPRSARTTAILAQLKDARFDTTLSEFVLLEMWEKWTFIASGAGITCLMRSAIGDIVTAGGKDMTSALIDECAGIAKSAGFAPRVESLNRTRAALTTPGSLITASMLRDMERGAQTEVEQILGDLLRRRGSTNESASMLRVAYVHVKAYEARRTRELKVKADRA